MCRRHFYNLCLALLLLAGAATDAVAAGRICTSNDTFVFGNRVVGSVATATATVSNCGDAPWSFTDASVHPATGPEFQVSATCITGLTLRPGDTCTVTVRFAPTMPGQTSGGYWLHNTTTTPDQIITFYGRGVDADSGSAALEFIPSSANFPPQAIGSQSTPMDIELHNLGPAALTLTAVVLNGPEVYDFLGYDNSCQVGSTIPAGESCHMVIFFLPQAAGTRLANLVIDSPELASLAIMQISGVATPPATGTPTVDVIEFYNAGLDHYFMTPMAIEIDALDAGRFPGWARTGRSFKGYPQPTAGASPVCRFYIPPPQDSHFYSASPAECAIVASTYPTLVLESSDLFYIALPDANGTCPSGTIAVYRLFNNRADVNHRYTTDAQIKAQMIGEGYIAEGYGPSATIMCAPQ
jgi:Abnormal spindle-like microcephaly-assoc'd, ASPM-SPD-2-Hydin/Repeat of unknown function (DUF5648)